MPMETKMDLDLMKIIKYFGPDPTIIGYNMLKYAFKDGIYVVNAIRDTYREKDVYYIKPEDLHVCMDNFKYLDGTKKKTICLCEMWFEDIYVSVPLDGYGKYWFIDKKEADFYRNYVSNLKDPMYTIKPYKNGGRKDDEQS